MGLLGSTALIAASLAVSPAFAQTIATPSGGGTITRTGGSSNTTDQTGAGGGVVITNVTQDAAISVNGVTINNTTGSPTADALRVLGETATLNSTGVTLTGVNTLTTTVNGGSGLYVQTGANMGVGITSSGSTFTGSYGINLMALGGYVAFNAAGQSQSFVANGTHIAGFNAVTGVNASIQLGSSTIAGFNTGINTSNFYGSYVEMTGGSINALVTGIRADATGGANNIQSQAAIVAQTGIYSTNSDTNGSAANVVTSGGGTINSTSNGAGAGISASNTGGSKNLNVTVGAAIGNVTRHGTGVYATTTGTATGLVNVATTGAISATGTAIHMEAVAGATANVQGAIIGSDGVYSLVTGGATNVTTSGAGTINAASANSGTGISVNTSAGSGVLSVNVGAAIGDVTQGAYGVRAVATGTSSGAISIVTSATIRGSTAGILLTRAAGTPTNTVTVGADVTGGTGIDGFSAGTTNYTIQQGATVTGTSSSTSGFGAAAVHTNSSAVTVSNSGTILSTGVGLGNTGLRNGSGAVTTNTATGSISGRTGVYNGSGSTVTNAGTITGTGAAATEAGVRMSGGTVNNTGTIDGGAYGVLNVNNGLVLNNTGGTITGERGIAANNTAITANITNSAGGVITGVIDGINIFGANAAGAITNSATINTGGGASSAAGVYLNRSAASIYSIANTGTITGGADATFGYAVSVDDGALTVNNNSGGQLNSLTGLAAGNAIRLNSDDLATLNLNLGSTVNGRILSTSAGARTTVLAGSVTGGYDGSGGTGVDTFTLASTGSIGGAVLLGGGDDIFTYQGGTFATVNAGAGTADAFVTNFSGGSGSVDMTNLSAFESHSHQSGTLTLTGNNTGAYGWVGSAGTTITLDGTLDGISNSSYAISMSNSASTTVNVLAGSIISGIQSGVQFNGGAIATMTNAGSISVAGSGVASVSGRVNLTNSAGGSIASSSFGGVFLASGGGTILNDGLISGGSDATFGYGLRSSNTASGGNNAAITNNATRTITGGTGGISMAGAGTMTVTNAGTISGTDIGSSGIRQTAGTVTITNNSGGSLIGNAYGVNVDTSGVLGLTNASGGAITGSTAAVRADTTGAATIDLQLGSATNGSMILSGSGVRTVNVAGGFFGNLDATGNSGAVNLTLNTSATGYVLLHAGSGTDSLTFNGSGSRSFSVDNLSGWETGSFTGGSWTLTGTGNQNSFTSGVTINGAALTVSNTQQFQGATGLTMTGGGSITTTTSLSNARTINLTGAGSLGVASGQTLTQSGVVSGAGVLTLNGPGTLVLSGNNTYTGGTVVNAGILRLANTSAAGTGLIRMIDPQIDFAATGTYNNNISLEVVDGQQAADPTILNNTSGGAITLAGRIYETAGVGGANQYVTLNGGSITLSNGANSWGGVTRINSGATVLGTNASISGGSIVNNGTLTYQNVSAGTASQNISGTGAININGTGLTLAGAITTSGQLTISGAGSNLILAGSRSGSSGTAALLSATGGSLSVADGGSIVGGGQLAVHMTGVGSTLNNLGSITNSSPANAIGAAVYVEATSGTLTINNGSAADTGAGSTIRGWNAGIRHDVSAGGLLVVNNYGLIMGDQYNGIENSTGALTVNNFAGGYITTGGNGNGVVSGAGAVSITNAGTIGRNIAGDVVVSGYGVSTNGALTLNNQAGGAIYGTQGGVQTNAAGASITNAGRIYAEPGPAISLAAGGSIVNGGSGLTAGQNTASFIDSGGASAIAVTNGAFSLQNYGRIIGAGSGMQVGTGAAYVGAVTIDNAGLIQGSSADGLQLNGAATVNNLTGGTIAGAGASLRLSGAYAYALNLAAGSTVNGMIDASLSSGANTTVLGGTLNGAYSGGSGIDTFTLGATGSMTSADLGVGADSFIYQGGAFSGVINAGSGADSFTSALGAGSGSVDLTNVVDFETFAHESGTLTLTGTRGFSGGASVTGGTLVVNGTLQTFASVASGATLSGAGTVTSTVTVANGGILANTQGSTLTTGALSLSSGSLINATFSGVGGQALFAVDGALTLDGTVNVASTGAFGFGVYGLMTYAGVLNDQGLLIGTTPGTAQRMSVQTSVAGQVNIVHAPNELLFWDGGNGAQHGNGAVNGGAGVWTAAGSEWTDANGLSNGAMEPQPGFAIFQGAGGTVTVDNSLGSVGVTGMQFAAHGYRIEGDAITLADAATVIRVGDGTAPSAGWTATITSALTDAGGLVKTDLGTLILAGDSDYTGGTTVNAGTLQIGDGATAGSIAGSVVLANGSTLVFSRNDNHDFDNAVSGTGSVGINGAVTLSGAITATGGVDVYSGGEVTVSNVTVASGSAVHLATNSLVTVASGGSVISQNGAGVESLGSSIYNYGSIQGTAHGVLTTGGSVWNFDSASAISGVTGIHNGSTFGLGVYNAGTITGSLVALYSVGPATLNNIASGTISGLYAINVLGNLNMANAGSISASVTNFNNSAIYAGGTGAILNTGTITSGTNAIYTQGAGLLTNSGLVQGGGAASTVRLFGANSSVINLAGGEITTTGNGAGVYLDGLGATVVNSGTIRGGNAVSFVSGGGSLTNDGVLIGTTASGVVGNGGTLIANLTGGTITGVTNGVNIVTGTGNLTNDGAITGASGQGVLLQAGGTITNTGDITGGQSGVRSLGALNLVSSGTIAGSVNAVETVGAFNDSLTFLAGSTTDGAVLTNGGDDLISLAGGLNGVLNTGDGADTVSLFDTASFSSILDGGDGVDAFVLDGSGNGSLDIGAVLNFESRAMNGAGVWTLSGTDVSTVGWNLLSGTLAVSGGSAINDAAGVTIGSGGSLALLDDETIAALSGSGFVDLGSSVLTLGGAQTSLYAGVISGFGDLVIGAGHGLTLTGANTYTGTTVVDGVLTLGASNVLADTSSLLVASGGSVDLQTFNEEIDNVFVEGVLNGSGTLTAFDYGLDGATVNANLGSGALYNLGGVSTLNGLIGADLVLVDAGTLVLGASDRLADTAVVGVALGATFDLGVFSETVDVAILQGTLAGTGTLTGAVYGLADATVNANLGTGLLFNIDGISTLNGTSSADLVVVDGGTLRLGASDRIVDTADLQILLGATFDLGAFDETVNLTAIEGTLSGSGTLTAFEHQLDGATIDANLAGASVYVVGGASTLNGVSSADLLSVLGGSLTLGASNRIADAAILGVSSGATLDIGAFDDTVAVAALAGTLAGTGTLTAGEYDLDGAIVNANLGAGDLFNIGGVSTLNGTSGSANVWVQAGTLAFGASNRLADTATVSVASGSTLNLGAFNDTVNLAALDGTLAGTGTLTAAQYQLNAAAVNANLGAGTLFNLGGVSTLNGTAAASAVFLNAGTLRLGANERLSDAASVSVATGATFNVNGFNERIGALFGTGNVEVGAGRLTFGGVESAFGGRLSGTGSVVHTGGLFTLLGNHSIASISNTGGELRFAGATTGGISASGGSVTGAGTIGGALTASNGAVLSPGLPGVQNGIGGFTAGGLTLNGGTLAIDVLGHSAGNLVDQLRINGAATLTGGLLAPTFHGTTVSDFATRYLFLQANNLVGTFANGSTFTAAAQQGLFWRVRYDLAPNAAVLELRQLTNLDPGASGTGNQRAIGQALSGGQLGASDDWAAVIGLIAGLSAAERAAAFDSISGEPLADVTTSMFSANDTFLTAVRDGGMGGRNDGGEALNFVGSLSFSGGRDNSADRLGDVLGAFDPSASTERGAGGWVSAYAGSQTLDGKPGQATVESKLNGFAGGYGVRHGSMSLGGAAGVTRVEGDVVARDGHYESDLSHAAGYVAFDDGVWAADVSASFYGGDLDTRRGIAVGAFRGTAIGNTHTEGQSLSASVARRFRVSDNTMVAIGATGTASNASVDGYTETGAGALSLQASGQERDWQSLQLSARGTQDYRVNGQGFRIYGGAGVMAMAGDRQATGDMRFTGAPVGFGTFVVEGAETPPLAGLVDFGLEVGAGEGVTVSAGYRGLFSERLQDNQIGVKLNVSW